MIDKRPPSESEVGATLSHQQGQRQGEPRRADPTPRPETRHPTPRDPRPDTPTRHPDTETLKGWRRGCEPNASRMQGGKKAVMRAECKGNATVKARWQEARGRGQRSKVAQPSQKRKRALALNTTTDKNTTSQPPRLLPFAPFGSVAPPCPFDPDPLPPASLLFRLHPFASACIGFFPLASACIGLQPLNLPFRVSVSGCRVGVSGLGSRGVGCRVSGRGVGSALLGSPCLCPC